MLTGALICFWFSDFAFCTPLLGKKWLKARVERFSCVCVRLHFAIYIISGIIDALPLAINCMLQWQLLPDIWTAEFWNVLQPTRPINLGSIWRALLDSTCSLQLQVDDVGQDTRHSDNYVTAWEFFARKMRQIWIMIARYVSIDRPACYSQGHCGTKKITSRNRIYLSGWTIFTQKKIKSTKEYVQFFF